MKKQIENKNEKTMKLTVKKQAKKKTPPIEITDQEFLAIGLYFAVSNAGQNTASLGQLVKNMDWRLVIARCDEVFQNMAADAYTIDGYGERGADKMYNTLLKEAKGFERSARKGDEYIMGEWSKLKSSGTR